MPIDWDEHVIGPTIDVFGEPATFLPKAGGSLPIEGVFDEAYREVSLIDDLGATGVMPMLGVRAAQFLVAPLRGDSVRIPSVGKLYVVKDIRPDGHGWLKLMLGYTGTP